MTMPSERLNALKMLKEAAYLIFARGKNRPSLTELRRIFRSALKHYPGDHEIDRLEKLATKMFKDPF